MNMVSLQSYTHLMSHHLWSALRYSGCFSTYPWTKPNGFSVSTLISVFTANQRPNKTNKQEPFTLILFAVILPRQSLTVWSCCCWLFSNSNSCCWLSSILCSVMSRCASLQCHPSHTWSSVVGWLSTPGEDRITTSSDSSRYFVVMVICNIQCEYTLTRNFTRDAAHICVNLAEILEGRKGGSKAWLIGAKGEDGYLWVGLGRR